MPLFTQLLLTLEETLIPAVGLRLWPGLQVRLRGEGLSGRLEAAWLVAVSGMSVLVRRGPSGHRAGKVEARSLQRLPKNSCPKCCEL